MANHDRPMAHRAGGRFLHRRAARAGEQAAQAVVVSVERVSCIVSSATALADRLEALPQHDDLALRLARQERVRHLRWAVAAGQEALRRQAQRSTQDGAADAAG